MPNLIEVHSPVNTESAVQKRNDVNVGQSLAQFQASLRVYLVRKASPAQRRFLQNAVIPCVELLAAGLQRTSILPRPHGGSN